MSEYASKIADMDKAPPPPPVAADKPIQWSDLSDLLDQAGLTDYEAAFYKHGYDDVEYLVETVASRDDLLISWRPTSASVVPT